MVGVLASWCAGCSSSEEAAEDENGANANAPVPPPSPKPRTPGGGGTPAGSTPAGSTPPGGASVPAGPVNLNAPILPPRSAGGFDFWAGDARPLATEQAVLAAFPMLTPMPSGGGAVSYTWEGKLDVSFAIDTGRVRTVSFYRGYPGTLSFKSSQASSFGEHAYVIRLGNAIERDGAPLQPDWNDHGDGSALAQLCRALLFTFTPARTPAEGVPLSSDDCEWGTTDYAHLGGFRVPRLAINMVADLPTDANPATTTIWSLYMHFFVAPYFVSP
jgi:hypothetical protein